MAHQHLKGRMMVLVTTNAEAAVDATNRSVIRLVVTAKGHKTSTISAPLTSWSWMISHVGQEVDVVIEYEEPEESEGGEVA